MIGIRSLVLGWVWLLALPAAAGKPQVLLARPKVAAALGASLAGQLRDGTLVGLTRSRLLAVQEGDVSAQLQRLALPDLGSRAAAMKVAHAIGAWAVVRYAARPAEAGLVDVRLSLHLVAEGKALMLERKLPRSALAEGITKMVRELVASAGAASAAPVARTPVASPPVASPPVASPPVGAVSPGSGTVAGSPQPAAASAAQPFPPPDPPPRPLEATVASGTSAVFADALVGLGLNGAEGLAAGFGFGATGGYRFPITSWFALAPELGVSYHRFGLSDSGKQALRQHLGAAVEGHQRMLAVKVGALAALRLGILMPWLGLHLGYAHVAVALENAQNSSDRFDDSVGGFALDFGFGLKLIPIEHLLCGLFFRFDKPFVDENKVADDLVTTIGLSFGTEF